MVKLYGKILENRLGGDTEARGVHSDFQFAFREDRSAMKTVYILGEILEVGIREAKKYRWAVLDIIKAYNRVVREIGYGGEVLRLIQRLYDENEGSFQLGGIQCRRIYRSNGLREGCILSPFLFVIYIRKAEERMVKGVLGYRDRSDNSDANLCGWYRAMWEVGHWVVTVVRDHLAGIR